MRILITGGTGFIGKILVNYLSRDKDNTLLLTCRNTAKANELFCSNNISIVDAEAWDKIREFNPEIIVHLAALNTSREDFDVIENLIDSNVTYGTKLLNALSHCSGLKLFINTGTFAQYWSPYGRSKCAYLYSASKSAFEAFLNYYSEKCGFRRITVVLYSVYGGDMTVKRVMDYILESTKATVPIDMTAGEQKLDFIHINDVIKFYDNLIRKYSLVPEDKTHVHVGTGYATKIREIADIISKITGKKCNINWGGRPYRENDIMFAKANDKEIWKILDWKPKITLEDYIEQFS